MAETNSTQSMTEKEEAVLRKMKRALDIAQQATIGWQMFRDAPEVVAIMACRIYDDIDE